MNPKDQVGAKKAPLGVVPPSLVPFTAPAMAVGANKYGPFNWREQPVQVMTYLEAAQRHILAFIDGQDVAEDTGVHHIAHAIAGLAIIADAISANNVIDNRPQAGPTPDILRAQDKSSHPQDAAPRVYPVQVITPVACSECGTTSPDHTLQCSRWDAVAVEAEPEEGWGLEGGVIFEVRGYPVTMAEDGCCVYRSHHIDPSAMNPDLLREIDQHILEEGDENP